MLGSSWAIMGGGQGTYLRVINKMVRNNDLKPPAKPSNILSDYCKKMNWREPTIGLMTSADISRYCFEERRSGGLHFCCLVTVGMGNARRVGDPAGPAGRISAGTINIIAWFNQPVHHQAHWEAISMISEGKTAAVLDSGVISPVSGLPATGTGTDCTAFLSPRDDRGLCYVGKHTKAGSLLGDAVYRAVKKGITKNLEAL